MVRSIVTVGQVVAINGESEEFFLPQHRKVIFEVVDARLVGGTYLFTLAAGVMRLEGISADDLHVVR